MKEKKDKSMIVGSIILILIPVAEIVMGILSFSHSKTVLLSEIFDGDPKGKYVRDKVEYATQNYYTLSHSVNFIPTGKEYYYVIFSEDQSDAIFVRAGKKWGRFFNSRTLEAYSGPVAISGKVKSLDYEARKGADKLQESFQSEGMPISVSYYYIDLLAKQYGILSILSGVLWFVIAAMFIYVNKGHSKHVKAWMAVSLILGVANGCFSLHVITML